LDQRNNQGADKRAVRAKFDRANQLPEIGVVVQSSIGALFARVSTFAQKLGVRLKFLGWHECEI